MGPNYFPPQYSCCFVGQPCIIRWTMWWSYRTWAVDFQTFEKREWHKNSHGGAYISIASVSEIGFVDFHAHEHDTYTDALIILIILLNLDWIIMSC
jgi:hypothetical protein